MTVSFDQGSRDAGRGLSDPAIDMDGKIEYVSRGAKPRVRDDDVMTVRIEEAGEREE